MPLRRSLSPWLAGAVLLCLLPLAPVWLLPFFPSQDGPSHLANVAALAQWTDPDAICRRFYDISLAPVPNWAATALLYPLLTLFSPLVAHRLFLTINALALTGGWIFWVAVCREPARVSDSERPARSSLADGLEAAGPLALIGPLLVTNFFLMKGLYSFCLSLPLFLLAVGTAWRHRAGLTGRSALGLNLLLAATWFGHLVSFAVALGCCVAILALSALGALRTSPRAAAERFYSLGWLLPCLAFPAWFATWSPAVASTGGWETGRSVGYLLRLGWLTWFDDGLALTAAVLSGLVIVLFAWNLPGLLRGRAEHLVFLPLLGGALFLSLTAPRGAAGGWYLNERLAVYPLLLLAPLLRVPRGAAGRAILTGVIGLAALVQFRSSMDWCRRSAAELAEFTALAPQLPPRCTVMGIVFRERDARPLVSPLAHAGSYYALAAGGVDLGNYEAATEHFQLHWKASHVPVDAAGLEQAPLRIDPAEWDPRPDYLVIWDPQRAGATTLSRIATHYRGVATNGRAVLLRRIVAEGAQGSVQWPSRRSSSR